MKEYIKRFIYIIGVVIFSINMIACDTSENELEDKYIEGQDQQFMFCDNGGKQKITKSSKGYYFSVGHYLYYIDDKGNEAIVMCNKPNCLHAEETNPYKVPECNALFPSPRLITYQGGKLYIVYEKPSKQNYELAEVSLDGTNRKTLYEFDKRPTGIALHRGKLYYSSSVFNNKGENVYGLEMIDLNTSNLEPKVIYTGELQGGDIQHILCYGKHIYFREISRHTEQMTVRAFRYDMEKDKVQRICTMQDEERLGSLGIIGDKLYYRIFSDTIKSSDNKSVFITDLNNSNIEYEIEMPIYTHQLSDGRNLFAIDNRGESSKRKEDRGISIYSKDGKFIIEYLLNCNEGSYKVYPGDEKYMFLLYESSEYMEWKRVDKVKMLRGENSVNTILKINREQLYPRTITEN